MKRTFFILFLLFFLFDLLSAQGGGKVYAYARIVAGDTIPVIALEEVTIVGVMTRKNKRAYKRYSKLVRNVKKVYPYARLAGLKLMEYEKLLAGVESEKERKR